MSKSRIVHVLDPNGKSPEIDFTGLTTKGELLPLLIKEGIDAKSLVWTILESGHTLVMENALLPDESFTLDLSPQRMKGNAYKVKYSETAGLIYTQLRAELKGIREQARKAKDKEIVKLIGDYSHMTTEQLRRTLKKVYGKIGGSDNPVKQEKVEVVVEDNNVSLEDRLFEVEYILGVRNTANQVKFNTRNRDRAREVLKGYQNTIIKV